MKDPRKGDIGYIRTVYFEMGCNKLRNEIKWQIMNTTPTKYVTTNSMHVHHSACISSVISLFPSIGIVSKYGEANLVSVCSSLWKVLSYELSVLLHTPVLLHTDT